MTDLKEICEDLGFAAVRTYIASGNVVFTSRKSEAAIKTALEKRLEAYAGKPVGVVVRTAEEMARVLSDNPFPKAAPNRTMAVFLDSAPPTDALAGIRGPKHDEIAKRRSEHGIDQREFFAVEPRRCSNARLEPREPRFKLVRFGFERGFVLRRVEACNIVEDRRSEFDPGAMLRARQWIGRMQ